MAGRFPLGLLGPDVTWASGAFHVLLGKGKIRVPLMAALRFGRREVDSRATKSRASRMLQFKTHGCVFLSGGFPFGLHLKPTNRGVPTPMKTQPHGLDVQKIV